MSILKSLNTAGVNNEKDTLGGGSKFGPWESGVYDVVIDTAYMDASAGGAINVNFTFKTSDGKELRSTQYITSGEAKGRLPYFIDKNGEKQFLPGYNIANAICLLTLGEEITELDTETKVLSLYDYTARKEVPQQKEVIMDLLGKEVTLGVLNVIEDKNVKNDAGQYVPSGETRTINEIDKVFRTADKLTTAEIRAEQTEAEFYTKWAESNTGKVRNKSKGAAAGNASAPAAGTPAPAKKLFGK